MHLGWTDMLRKGNKKRKNNTKTGTKCAAEISQTTQSIPRLYAEHKIKIPTEIKGNNPVPRMHSEAQNPNGKARAGAGAKAPEGSRWCRKQGIMRARVCVQHQNRMADS